MSQTNSLQNCLNITLPLSVFSTSFENGWMSKAENSRESFLWLFELKNYPLLDDDRLVSKLDVWTSLQKTWCGLL